MVAKTPLEAESTDSLRLLFRILCCQSEAVSVIHVHVVYYCGVGLYMYSTLYARA